MRMLIGLAAVAMVAGCSSTSKTPAAPVRFSPPPTAVAIDDPARQMCAELLKAGLLDATGNPTPASGWGASADQMDAYTARIKAQDYALHSKVPAIQQLAAEQPIDVTKLQRWCTDNSL